ncbi:hypothetical protein Q7P35_002320 [Cladosporium inversicolor]
MRSATRTRTFWIDCICIDESNDLEKGHQVGLIANIFQNSQRTLSHLGDDDDNTARRAFWGLRVIQDAWAKTNYRKIIQEVDRQTFENRDLDNWSSLREKVGLVAIKAIITNPYFKDCFVPRNYPLLWRMGRGLASIIPAATWLMFNPSAFGNAINHDNQLNDPRDRVFGMLGLLKLSTEQSPSRVNLAPDYTKSVVDVYSDATRACIGECDPPWLLESFGYEREAENRIENLPLESRALELPRHAGLWAYEYRSADTPLVPDSSTGIVLSIRVVALEKVSKYSVVLTHGDPRSYFEFMSEAHDILSDDATHVSVNLEQLNRLDHILGAGYKDAKVFRCFVECLRFMVHARHCTGRRAFITKSGLLGLGPKALQDGDVIVVSKLGPWPMVLRQAEDSGPDHYTVTGQAIVEGIISEEKVFAAAAECEDISPLNQAMRTQIRRLRTTLGLDVESPCNIEHKSRLACQTLHLLAAIRNVYARHQATGMRSLGCAAVDDVDSLSVRAKVLRVLGQADKAQNFFGDGGTDGLVLQEFAEYMHAGIVFAALDSWHELSADESLSLSSYEFVSDQPA